MRRRAELIIEITDEITGKITETYSSKDFDFYVTTSDSFRGAERDRTEVIIPGRNGSVFRDNGRYNSVLVTYSAFVHRNFIDNFNAFKNILLGQTRKFRLRDSNDPDHYREALYSGEISGTGHILEEIIEVQLEFICSPERFSEDGDLTVERTTSGGTNNETFRSGVITYTGDRTAQTRLVGHYTVTNVTISGTTATVTVPLPNTVRVNANNIFLTISTGVDTPFVNAYTFTATVPSGTSLSVPRCEYYVIIDSETRSVIIDYTIREAGTTTSVASGSIRLTSEVSGNYVTFPLSVSAANPRMIVYVDETAAYPDYEWEWTMSLKEWEL